LEFFWNFFGVFFVALFCFFLGIFLLVFFGGLLGGFFWEELFGMNSLFTLELTCLSRFWSNGEEGRKEGEFSILRSAIASPSHLKKFPHDRDSNLTSEQNQPHCVIFVTSRIFLTKGNQKPRK
jgi:hypothetical protein